MDLEHLLQCRCAPFRLHLLERPNDGVHQDDDEDEGRVGEVDEEDGDDPRCKEDVDERARELAEEDLEHRRRALLREGVRPEDLLPASDLFVREAPGRRCEHLGCFVRR
jgi:hypothetical protein